jgi:glycosyltransferase involved in cell wall biosynthesis
VSTVISGIQPVQSLALVGHPYIPIGTGEQMRAQIRSLRAVGLPVTVVDVYDTVGAFDPDVYEQNKKQIPLEIRTRTLSKKMNLFCINGDEIEPVLRHLGDRLETSAYNIVFPFWELSNFPDDWAKQLSRFQEVWVASEFVANAVRVKVKIPVKVIPLSVEVKLDSFMNRLDFGIRESAFVFLSFFDFSSYIARKNPLAAVDAFDKCLRRSPRNDLQLVMKSNNSGQRPEEFKSFKQEVFKRFAQSASHIHFIDRTLMPNEVRNLIRLSDCVVSLHRSEGYGRVPAEAMYLGKPIVATNYSGNVDYMTPDNSCGVDYKLIPLLKDEYPHWEGQQWADPNVETAAEYMRALSNDDQYRMKIGQAAKTYARAFLSDKAVGKICFDRIKEIHVQLG